MPKNDWYLTQKIDNTPDYIPEDQAHLFPAAGQGQMQRDWIPDSDSAEEQEKWFLTPDEERTGVIGWTPGTPEPKKKKMTPFLSPSDQS